MSRMKTRGEHVRFVAVSASVRPASPICDCIRQPQVPNIDDVARWLGQSPSPLQLTGIYEAGGAGQGKKENDTGEAVDDLPMAKVFKVIPEHTCRLQAG